MHFSIDEKTKIAHALDDLGVDYIEGGWPGANPSDTEFFQKGLELKNSTFTAFGMTKKAGRSAENDPGLSAILNSNTKSVCLVGKSWDFHVDVALGITNEENLENIKETTKHFVKNNKEFMFDAEHFFDGYKANPKYALACIKAAYDNGAKWIVLCDTNGGTLPHEVTEIVKEVSKHIPGENLGIHAHNDTGNAVANSIAAVLSGARQIQGTINGLGERCGNANLMSIIPTFHLKKELSDKFEISIKEKNIKHITQCSRLLDEILNRKPNKHLPYVGAAAFSHKGGLHVSAVQKDPKTYEHINPEDVGNNRNIVVSDQSGRSNIMSRLKTIGIEISEDDPKITSALSILLGSIVIEFCRCPDLYIALFILTPSTTINTLFASKPLIIGLPPPPWLFWILTPGLNSSSSAPEEGEVKKTSADFITDTFSATWFMLDSDLATDNITSRADITYWAIKSCWGVLKNYPRINWLIIN